MSNTQFNISNLRPGMSVKLRDGSIKYIIPQALISPDGTKPIPIEQYNTHTLENIYLGASSQYDIITVFNIDGKPIFNTNDTATYTFTIIKELTPQELIEYEELYQTTGVKHS